MAISIPVPQQERSRRTMERLLDAAVEVLAEKDFDSATAAEIAARAGYTVGAFYARFPNKEAMWIALAERVGGLMKLKFDPLDALDPDAVPLTEAIDAVVKRFVSMYVDHAGLMLAVRRPASVQPNLAVSIRRINEETLGRLAAVLGRWVGEISRPNPKRAIQVALLMMATSLREYLLEDVSRLTTKRPITASALSKEVKVAMCAYLMSEDV